VARHQRDNAAACGYIGPLINFIRGHRRDAQSRLGVSASIKSAEGVDQNLDDLLCAVHASSVPGSTVPAPETG
jgi:hypothetical protein